MSYIQWNGHNQQQILDFCDNAYFKKELQINISPNPIEMLYLRYDFAPPLYVPLNYYIIKNNNGDIFVDSHL